ncbi:hypothetical protein A2969_02445 [Candidatus Woesebacteria bacterium RIFCSPLOWO2_01_FULL_42_67]|nr:MAG: hypothetical protein A2969_02445 [Candidatus Woesebacteria bacterium RIFCSPLOWO2_01_FULL_42_67]
MNKVLIAVVIIVVAAGAFWFLQNQSTSSPTPTQTSNPTPQSTSAEFSTPKKSAHWESSTPEHGSILAAVPVNMVIDFNFDLAKRSDIQITVDSKEYGMGETVIDPNKLTMRKKMDPNSPDGLYTVIYKACWADGSCHDGLFQFKIDKSVSKDFIDMTNKKEVTINLTNYAFSPSKVKVSKGTKITWINQDSVIHTINSDPHPSHTYYLTQNSRDLKKGDSYSVTFIDRGIYLYHCTPHADTMKAAILVE